nr:hypothetical protein HAGR004_24860 [Bdellovibrio sp. HAGR004]
MFPDAEFGIGKATEWNVAITVLVTAHISGARFTAPKTEVTKICPVRIDL